MLAGTSWETKDPLAACRAQHLDERATPFHRVSGSVLALAFAQSLLFCPTLLVLWPGPMPRNLLSSANA